MRLAGLVLVLSVASSAAAQDPRALFEQGNAATAEGRFADARDHYRASLELEANPATAFNLAVALTRTGEFVGSVALFDALLEGTYGRLSRAQRQEVSGLKRDAAANVATLRIEVPPVRGLEVRVDGQLRTRTARLDPGPHIVAVTTSRHQPIERELVLERGEERVFAPTLRLRPDLTRGRLVVEAPDGGHLSIPGVGEAIGRLDLDLEAGTYRLRLEADGREREREVVVEAATTSRYEIDVAPRRRVWLWVVVGALLVGGVTTALVLTRTEQPPREDPVYGTIATLRFE